MRRFSFLALLIVLFIAGYLMFTEGKKSVSPSSNLGGTDAGVEQRVNESISKYQESLQQGMQESGSQ